MEGELGVEEWELKQTYYYTWLGSGHEWLSILLILLNSRKDYPPPTHTHSDYTKL